MREGPVLSQGKLVAVLVAVIAGVASNLVRSQEMEGPATTPPQPKEARKIIASPEQVVAILAGRLFDARSGSMLNNQVILVMGDRIAEVGAGVQIPAGATVLDLSSATVLPGMIDTHVHLNTIAANTAAKRGLIAL